jgi:hypothetical protein
MKKRILYMMFAGVAACAAAVLVKNTASLSGGEETVPAPGPRPDASPSESRADAPDFAIDRTSARQNGMLIPAAPEAPAYPEEGPDLADSHPAPQNPGSAGTAAGRPTRTAAKSVAVRVPPTSAKRAQRARQVEEDADLQLARLDRQVGLTVEQATSAFVAYAQQSAAYDPSIPIEVDGLTMAAGGAGSGSAETQIYTMLNEEQQAAFGQEMLNRDLWWTEIIAQLAADFPEAPAPEAVQPSAHQGDNILDILNQAN